MLRAAPHSPSCRAWATPSQISSTTDPSVLYTHKKIQSGPAANAQYINPAAFTQNPTGTFGDSKPFAYRGPVFVQVDSALDRSFAWRESLALTLRLEACNVLNHPDFATPEGYGYR